MAFREIQGVPTGLFPAEAGPTIERRAFSGSATIPNGATRASGTGFSREAFGWHAAILRVPQLAHSRLKPVPLLISIHSRDILSNRRFTAPAHYHPCGEPGPWRVLPGIQSA